MFREAMDQRRVKLLEWRVVKEGSSEVDVSRKNPGLYGVRFEKGGNGTYENDGRVTETYHHKRKLSLESNLQTNLSDRSGYDSVVG